MKRILLPVICFIGIVATREAKGQTFQFPIVFSPAGCAFTYEIAITIKLDSVKVTNIYFDDGTNGSFAFEAYVSYQNTFANSTLPAGNFFTYEIALFSDNTNLNPQSITNNAGNVPVQTSGAGGLPSQNNPTYNASASALNLVAGGVYNSPSLLNVLGYDSATLHINLPCLDTVTTSDNSGTLPVLWTGIKGEVKGQEIVLSWQTLMEQNNLGFRIERSLDGTNWLLAGSVNSKGASGNSLVVLSYQYRQSEQLAGRYYYRVVQRDMDGRSNVSNIVMLSITDGQGLSGLMVYPNPSTDVIILRQLSSNTPYSIIDSYGRIMLQGRYQQRIDVSRLGAGSYWVRAEGMFIRFVIIK